MELSRSVDSEPSTRRLALPAAGFDSRDAIEGYLHRLNHSSPLAQRDIAQWGRTASPSLRLTAVPLGVLGTPGDMFMGEAQTSFALDVRAQRPAAAGAPYSVGLLLAGTMRVTLADGEHVAHAGEGVIVDPAEVERTQFSVDSHFLEFALPKQNLLRLGAELAAGDLAAGTPGFACVLRSPLAQRLLLMATQAAHLLGAGHPAAATRVMFERWMEMIALTLLVEQRAGPTAPAEVGTAGAPPRSVSRALDFIDAHAQTDILLADIAAAACVSASTLLRQFNEHVGQTPAAFLRQVRLDRARAELRRGGSGSIRELAQRWGFQSAGKFSQAYLRRFGERPGQAR